jgi:hypothetical protein
MRAFRRTRGVLLLVLFGLLTDGAYAEVCIKEDPRPGLWPRADFAPSLRPGVLEGLAREGVPPGQDLGSLRLNPTSGCWEVMARLVVWVNYDPSVHLSIARKNSRIGPGWSGGHTSDDGFSFAQQHEEVTGQRLEWEGMTFVDYEYNRGMRVSIQARWCQLQPEPRPLACGGSPGAGAPGPARQDPPGAAPSPSSGCDGVCQSTDRTCSAAGILSGGKCPADCDPCLESVQPSPTGHVPNDTCGQELSACDAELAVCIGIRDRTASTLRSRDDLEIPALQARITALEARSPLPRDIEAILRGEWSRVANSGLGLRSRYYRSVRSTCAAFTCPLDLPGWRP